jgi:hypothetical protein
MGGVGSGRSSVRSLVEHSLTLDLRLMMSRHWIKDGQQGTFKLRFSQSGEIIRLFYDLRDPYQSSLDLNYKQSLAGGFEPEVAQHIPLTFTVPHFGGRRWWMICDGRRVAKIYMPLSGDSFGTREAWGLVYRSQRESAPKFLAT